MPVTSQAQARFMRGVESGSIHEPGLSPAKAAEFVQGVPYRSLPARAPKRRGMLSHAIRKGK